MVIRVMMLLFQTTIGLTLAGTHGTHRESGGTANAPFIPAPVVSVSHTFHRFELNAEGLPPLGPITVANNGLGMHNVALTYADATLRYWNRQNTLAFGLGETIYNQRTDLVLIQTPFMLQSDVDSSRVVGVEYEVVGRMPAKARDFWEARFAFNPRMHGRFSYNRQTAFSNGHAYQYTSPSIWETASEVDAGVRFVHAFGPFQLSYGVRYLNYTAAFTAPGAPFADANSLLMPYIGLQRVFGH